MKKCFALGVSFFCTGISAFSATPYTPLDCLKYLQVVTRESPHTGYSGSKKGDRLAPRVESLETEPFRLHAPKPWSDLLNYHLRFYLLNEFADLAIYQVDTPIMEIFPHEDALAGTDFLADLTNYSRGAHFGSRFRNAIFQRRAEGYELTFESLEQGFSPHFYSENSKPVVSVSKDFVNFKVSIAQGEMSLASDGSTENFSLIPAQLPPRTRWIERLEGDNESDSAPLGDPEVLEWMRGINFRAFHGISYPRLLQVRSKNDLNRLTNVEVDYPDKKKNERLSLNELAALSRELDDKPKLSVVHIRSLEEMAAGLEFKKP